MGSGAKRGRGGGPCFPGPRGAHRVSPRASGKFRANVEFMPAQGYSVFGRQPGVEDRGVSESKGRGRRGELRGGACNIAMQVARRVTAGV
eukprot:3728282-Pyramimonas_sp.AAC.1